MADSEAAMEGWASEAEPPLLSHVRAAKLERLYPTTVLPREDGGAVNFEWRGREDRLVDWKNIRLYVRYR